MSKCPAITGKGEPCQGFVHPSKTYCPAHDPSRVEARRAAASKAGRSKSGSEIAAVKSQLRTLANDVLAKRVDRGTGSVAAQILGVWLKACEGEVREREARVKELEFERIRLPEFEELSKEVAEIRETLEHASGSRRWPA